MQAMLRKVLIANRGEIALRVVRACRELGIASVVVYSDDDEGSAAVTAADERVRIGPAAAKRSYLNMPALLEAAARTGADAVHPGYGFLSEDPDFAEVCADEGLTFIGPPAEVLAVLGDKPRARALMARAGLPLLPGSSQPLRDLEEAVRLADEIGYPLVLKAVAGGGGRGMHVARSRADLAEAYTRSRVNAQTFFGDGRVYAERFLESARHVEVQVFCDAHGAAVSLGERDCTVQRRNQKLVEETPAPALPAAVLGAMEDGALRGARAAGYVGAGTFEFLVDPDHRFYFMEVNGRLQVEHAVTEMATGLDLVHEQLSVAAGAGLSFGQQDVERRGVVLECRVNAEDPERGFLPTPGQVERFRMPGGPFVRVDTHLFAGARISPAYDSLVAKVVVWGPDRTAALARMARALGEVEVAGRGIRTTAGFLVDVLAHPQFVAARHSTALVADMTGERRGLSTRV